MASGRPAWNAEILGSEARRCLWQGRGWLMAGLLLQFAIALYYIFLSPFSLEREFRDLVLCAQLLAGSAALLSIAWLCSVWLAPQQQRDESLSGLPISAVQLQLMDWLGLLLVPTVLALAGVAVWGVLQLYFGQPFGNGSELGAQYMMTDGPQGWREVPNPWWPRVLATALAIKAAGLLPLAIGAMLERCLRWPWLRIISILLLYGAGGYMMLNWGREFTQMCYRQTRGHEKLPYLILGLLILAMPVSLGLLPRRWRMRLMLASLAILLAIALLPFLQDSLQQPGLSARLRDAMGDSRFALAWYFGHTDFVQNIGWLMDSWTRNLLLGSPEKPLRIPVWVGAALLPMLYALWLPTGYLLGLGLSRQRADD